MPTEPQNFSFWYDGGLIVGKKLELAIDDPGLIYGATVFTTLRVYGSLDHPLTDWAGHCDRLQTSLQAFSWVEPDWERLHQGATLLIPQFPVLRIALFPDGREWITGRYLPADLAQRQQKGITAWLAAPSDPIVPAHQPLVASTPLSLTRSLPGHKTGNYLAPWLALQTAQQLGAQEAILVDTVGNWLETSTGNLWGWYDGCWWTPPQQAGILPGLLRSRLIQWLKCQNEEVTEVDWEADLVERLVAIAYTNCVVEVIPIHTILRNPTTLTYSSFHSSLQKLQGLFCSDPS